jgi:hypothetical protein
VSDKFATWLGQVHADHDLSAHVFRLAFSLTQIADGTGFLRSGAVAKLGRDIGDIGEPIAVTLERLIARGHLHAVGNGSKVKGFRLVMYAVKVRRQRTAHLIPFPSNRRRAFVEKQAQTMARMPLEKGDAYLRSQIAIQGDSMRRKGIEEEAIGRVLRDLQSAIRAELFRCVLLGNPREPA